MNTLQALATATVDIARPLPQEDLPALADAALRLLEHNGLAPKRTTFLHLFRRIMRKEKTTLPLTLATASGNAGPHRESIASLTHAATGKLVELQESVDPTLLGGALIAYGDERFDASLRGALGSLHHHLSSPLSYDSQ